MHSGFFQLSVELAFRIPFAGGIPDSLSCFLDSKAQDYIFWIPQAKFPGFHISQARISRITESGFP